MKLYECQNALRRLTIFAGLLTICCLISCSSLSVKTRRLARGEENLQKFKYEEAVMDFRAAADIDPASAEAQWGLARAYESLGEIPETMDALRRVIAINPNNLDAKAKLGNYCLAAIPPQFDEAQKIVDDILLTDSRFIEGHILRASLLSAQNRPEQDILEVLNYAISLDPKRVESYLSLARFQMTQEHSAEAEKVIEKAISVSPGSPLGYLEYGRFLSFAGRNEEAEAQFRTAIEVAPKNVEARESLASFYINQRSFDQAERVYMELADSQNDSPESLTKLADFYTLVEREDEAIKIFEQILIKNPNYLRARYRLGEIFLERRDFEKADAQVTALLESDGSDAEALLLLSRVELVRDRPDEAVVSLEKVLKRQPANKSALYYMTQARLALGQIDQARAFIGDLEKYHPQYLYSRLLQVEASFLAGESQQAFHQSNALVLTLKSAYPTPEISAQKLEELRIRALIARGNANLELQKLAEANEDFQEVLRRSPGSSMAHANIARVALEAKDYQRAASGFEKALSLDAKNFDALTGLIDTFKTRDDFSAAHSRLDHAINASHADMTELAALHYLKADVFIAEENSEAAERELRAAIEADENYLPAYSSYAAVMISQNQTDRAIEQYEKIVKRKPSAATYTLIGMLQDAKENFDEAQKNYRKALEITPDISIAANNLAWNIADRESGNLDEAMQFAQSAADREPKVASYFDTLGWVYYKKGLYAPAIEHLRKAVALDERESNRFGRVSNPAYRLRLALVLASSGDRPNARKEVEVALKNEQGLSPEEARDAKNLLGSL
jgi:tetratricopeptide (TPR) repeat protein